MNEPPLEGGWDREAYSPTTPLEGAAGGAGPGDRAAREAAEAMEVEVMEAARREREGNGVEPGMGIAFRATDPQSWDSNILVPGALVEIPCSPPEGSEQREGLVLLFIKELEMGDHGAWLQVEVHWGLPGMASRMGREDLFPGTSTSACLQRWHIALQSPGRAWPSRVGVPHPCTRARAPVLRGKTQGARVEEAVRRCHEGRWSARAGGARTGRRCPGSDRQVEGEAEEQERRSGKGARGAKRGRHLAEEARGDDSPTGGGERSESYQRSTPAGPKTKVTLHAAKRPREPQGTGVRSGSDSPRPQGLWRASSQASAIKKSQEAKAVEEWPPALWQQPQSELFNVLVELGAPVAEEGSTKPRVSAETPDDERGRRPSSSCGNGLRAAYGAGADRKSDLLVLPDCGSTPIGKQGERLSRARNSGEVPGLAPGGGDSRN